jgi:putative SOS response-associated peptidase YedK
MCFFTQQTKSAKEVENRFSAKIQHPEMFKSFQQINGFTFPKTPVITNQNNSTIQHFQWGLIPLWASDENIKKYTLNAKIETIHQKPSFKNVVNNRCLIIADGFFEWQWLDAKGKKKQPYLITLPHKELFSFAGIWSEWINKNTGELINSYSIITTEANELMSEIHNTKKRMPVILGNHNELDWLNLAPIENFKKVDLDLLAKKNNL